MLEGLAKCAIVAGVSKYRAGDGLAGEASNEYSILIGGKAN